MIYDTQVNTQTHTDKRLLIGCANSSATDELKMINYRVVGA